MKRDEYFKDPVKVVPSFRFDQGVVDCFDDMVSRSVPYYHEIHRILSDIVSHQVEEGDRIYDLGCSTGTTLKFLSQCLEGREVELIGLDKSAPMIKKAKQKCAPCFHSVQLLLEDLRNFPFQQSALVVMNYTLQFIPVEQRLSLLCRISRSLRPGGLLVLTEKIQSQNPFIEALQTELYCDFKRRNGYSELEIAQKREALENTLIPLPPETQLEFLRASGFHHVDMIFRWFNFACFVGKKSEGS